MTLICAGPSTRVDLCSRHTVRAISSRSSKPSSPTRCRPPLRRAPDPSRDSTRGVVGGYPLGVGGQGVRVLVDPREPSSRLPSGPQEPPGPDRVSDESGRPEPRRREVPGSEGSPSDSRPGVGRTGLLNRLWGGCWVKEEDKTPLTRPPPRSWDVSSPTLGPDPEVSRRHGWGGVCGGLHGSS